MKEKLVKSSVEIEIKTSLDIKGENLGIKQNVISENPDLLTVQRSIPDQ